MSRRSWIFLDVDDTLVGTFETSVTKYGIVAQRLGLLAPSADDLLAAGYGVRSFDECVQALFPSVDPSVIGSDYDRLAHFVPPVALVDAGSLVEWAHRRNVGVGVLTNGSRRKTLLKLQVAGLSPSDLDVLRTSDETLLRKPAPQVFSDLCRELSAAPEQSWYVSDSPEDWTGAEAAGLGSIGVLGRRPLDASGMRLPRLAVPDCGSIEQLFDVLPECRPKLDLSETLAVTFDVGNTLLIQSIDVPSLLAAAAGRSVDLIEARLAFELSSLPAEAWTSDAGNRAALIEAYAACVPALGAAARDVAGRVYAKVSSAAGWRLLNGRATLIQQLWKTPLRTGVISNWQSDLIETLARHGLAGFDTVVTSCGSGRSKPGAEIFGHACDQLDITPSALLHLGDSALADVGGALAAGARAAFVRPSDSDAVVAAVLGRLCHGAFQAVIK